MHFFFFFFFHSGVKNQSVKLRLRVKSMLFHFHLRWEERPGSLWFLCLVTTQTHCARCHTQTQQTLTPVQLFPQHYRIFSCIITFSLFFAHGWIPHSSSGCSLIAHQVCSFPTCELMTWKKEINWHCHCVPFPSLLPLLSLKVTPPSAPSPVLPIPLSLQSPCYSYWDLIPLFFCFFSVCVCVSCHFLTCFISCPGATHINQKALRCFVPRVCVCVWERSGWVIKAGWETGWT